MQNIINRNIRFLPSQLNQAGNGRILFIFFNTDHQRIFHTFQTLSLSGNHKQDTLFESEIQYPFITDKHAIFRCFVRLKVATLGVDENPFGDWQHRVSPIHPPRSLDHVRKAVSTLWGGEPWQSHLKSAVFYSIMNISSII
jgi:hypothetical protein